MSLKLNYFLPSNCVENYIDIYDGENDTFPLLRRYCGRNTTSVNQVLSNGSTILIVFKSGNNSLRPSILQGFHAVYEGKMSRVLYSAALRHVSTLKNEIFLFFQRFKPKSHKLSEDIYHRVGSNFQSCFRSELQRDWNDTWKLNFEAFVETDMHVIPSPP